MSGSRRPTAAEQHLGDRLSALVDGELGHEMRERVLAHLATCAKCKAEADAQRRLKNVFAKAAPPPPSESFLARLQGLCAGGDVDGGGTPLSGGGFGRRFPRTTGLPGVFSVTDEPFGYAPAGPHATALSPSEDRAPGGDRGFRIHPVGRQGSERSPSRGRWFAFVAAGAVSLAALALGGAAGAGGMGMEARGGPGTGSNATPLRSSGTGGGASLQARRQSASGVLLGPRALERTPLAPAQVSAPLLAGASASGIEDVCAIRALTAPAVAGAVAMSPLSRPLTASAPLLLPTAPPQSAPGLPARPAPFASRGPSSPNTGH